MQVQTVNLGDKVSTHNLTNRLSCRLDGLSSVGREQQRGETLKRLGLFDTEIIPLFDEATQTAARFLEAPICILGVMVHDHLWLKSAVGLSRLGLMNPLAASRKIPSQEDLNTYVVDSGQPLVINDTLAESIFARSSLVQHYGIRAFLGAPLITFEGQCIGTLAVMDIVPRHFTLRDVEFLVMTARWCLREFEQHDLLTTRSSQENTKLTVEQLSDDFEKNNPDISPKTPEICINRLKLQLLQELIEEIQTPLTSVVGMSSVLEGEVFGSLSHKQKEYVKIIHHSGQQMNSLVKEILKIGGGKVSHHSSQLKLTPVNIEILAQKIINSLCDIAHQKKQTFRLSVEPGKRICLLDKDKVQQALYYLVISVLKSSEADGDICIHVSHRGEFLNMAVWNSHPWVGDGLPQVSLAPLLINNPLRQQLISSTFYESDAIFTPSLDEYALSASSLATIIYEEQTNQLSHKNSQGLLGLLLGCYLGESHGGDILIQGSPASGYRYVLRLPKMVA